MLPRVQQQCTWYFVAIVLIEPVSSMQAVRITILTVPSMLYTLQSATLVV